MKWNEKFQTKIDENMIVLTIETTLNVSQNEAWDILNNHKFDCEREKKI